MNNNFACGQHLCCRVWKGGNMAEFSPKLKEALSLVQKPGRYTGGEPGCTYKDKANVDVRMAFCFPDTL